MIRIRLLNPHAGAAMATMWGYWRKIEDWELNGPWVRDDPWTAVCWFTEIANPHGKWASIHCATQPELRRERDWLAQGVQVLWTIAALGEWERLYVQIPEDEKDLHWRAFRRYLRARGWNLDSLGAYLQVLEPEDPWVSSFPRSVH